MEQRTSEWYSARLGKVTASRVADIIAKTKSGYSASRANYMAELVCERLTGKSGDNYQSGAMLWGTETEPLARAAYEAHTGNLVEETGFVPHFVIGNSGASPDGLIGEEGLIEIKCPNTSTHIDTLLGQSVPGKYITQIHWQMACTDRSWCDFVSFDPRMPDGLQLFIKRVERDDNLVQELQKEVIEFLKELDAKLEKLTKLCAKGE